MPLCDFFCAHEREKRKFVNGADLKEANTEASTGKMNLRAYSPASAMGETLPSSSWVGRVKAHTHCWLSLQLENQGPMKELCVQIYDLAKYAE